LDARIVDAMGPTARRTARWLGVTGYRLVRAAADDAVAVVDADGMPASDTNSRWASSRS
jgi:hypothetical protein